MSSVTLSTTNCRINYFSVKAEVPLACLISIAISSVVSEPGVMIYSGQSLASFWRHDVRSWLKFLQSQISVDLLGFLYERSSWRWKCFENDGIAAQFPKFLGSWWTVAFINLYSSFGSGSTENVFNAMTHIKFRLGILSLTPLIGAKMTFPSKYQFSWRNTASWSCRSSDVPGEHCHRLRGAKQSLGWCL